MGFEVITVGGILFGIFRWDLIWQEFYGRIPVWDKYLIGEIPYERRNSPKEKSSGRFLIFSYNLYFIKCEPFLHLWSVCTAVTERLFVN